MKKILYNCLLTLILFTISVLPSCAYQFNLLVLPTDIMASCDNYFCFPEVAEIIAEDVIQNLKTFNNIEVTPLAQVRNKLTYDSELRNKTISVLDKYSKNEQIDFGTLQQVANAFGVKSVLLVTSYSINDKTNIRRDLWDTMEISNAFNISYPFVLKTSAVLTDCVNNVVMWSGKYSKEVSDSKGHFAAKNQTQALSQLEKIKQYSYSNVSKNISQNIFMRFFPQEIKTFNVAKQEQTESQQQLPKFVPNALNHLSDPYNKKELDKQFKEQDYSDDFIFTF